MPIKLEDSATRALITAMSGLSLRQRVIGNNIANIDTPGFKASEVNFAEELAAATGEGASLRPVATHPGHLSSTSSAVTPEIETRRDTSQRIDGNNVDIEKEMEQLAETMLHYQTAARLVSRRLAGLRAVITGGRGA